MTRLLAALAALGLATAVLAAAGLFVGSAPVSARAVVAVLTGQGTRTPVDEVVVLSLRLPRIAAALLAGGALAVAGVGFQGLTRNPARGAIRPRRVERRRVRRGAGAGVRASTGRCSSPSG